MKTVSKNNLFGAEAEPTRHPKGGDCLKCGRPHRPSTFEEAQEVAQALAYLAKQEGIAAHRASHFIEREAQRIRRHLGRQAYLLQNRLKATETALVALERELNRPRAEVTS